jgi:hypothetical protein
VTFDLGRPKVKVKDEDNNIILLTVLPPSYKNLVTYPTCGKTPLAAREVTLTLLSYDQQDMNSVV